MATASTPFIEVSFAPSMALVSHVREFASAFYQHTLEDPDLISRLGVATHELLENAVKHSSNGLTRVRIELHPEPRTISIRTWNRPTSEHLEILKQNLEEIARSPDPGAHYQLLMRRSAKRTVGSGLGLGRIRAEAEFVLRCETHGPEVEVIAECPVPGGT